MTNAQIVAIGVRLFCIWLVVYLVRDIPGLWTLGERELQEPAVVRALVILLILVPALVVLLWRFPLAVARKLLPTPSLDEPTPLPIEQLERAGFCLLGLWVLTEAVPKLIYVAVIGYHATRTNPIAAFDLYNYAALLSGLMELIIGVWLLFGAKGLLGVLRWARNAGLSESSNNVVESDARQESPRAPHHER